MGGVHWRQYREKVLAQQDHQSGKEQWNYIQIRGLQAYFPVFRGATYLQKRSNVSSNAFLIFCRRNWGHGWRCVLRTWTSVALIGTIKPSKLVLPCLQNEVRTTRWMCHDTVGIGNEGNSYWQGMQQCPSLVVLCYVSRRNYNRTLYRSPSVVYELLRLWLMRK